MNHLKQINDHLKQRQVSSSHREEHQEEERHRLEALLNEREEECRNLEGCLKELLVSHERLVRECSMMQDVYADQED